MMFRNLRFHFYAGLSGALFTFVLSMAENGWPVSLIRGFIGFVLFFAAAFWFSFALSYIAAERGKQPEMTEQPGEEEYPQKEAEGQKAAFEPFAQDEKGRLADNEAQHISKHIKELFKEDDNRN